MTVSGSLLHQRPAGGGQRDHPARHIAVQRRDDHRGAPLAGQVEHLLAGRAPLEITSSAAPRSIASRWASARLPTTTTSPSEMPLSVRRRPSSAPRRGPTAGGPRRRAARPRARRRSRSRRWGPPQGRGAARLADVAPGERPLGEDTGQRAVVVDDRHQLEVGLAPSPAPPRGSARPGRPIGKLVCITSGRAASRGAGTSARGRRCARAASASGRCSRRAGPGRTRCRGRAGRLSSA